jgi:hypothetical protein
MNSHNPEKFNNWAETTLQDAVAYFKKLTAKAHEEAIDQIYASFLPYLEFDAGTNMLHQLEDEIKKFLAEEPNKFEEILLDPCESKRNLRERIYLKNKELLQNQIIEDLRKKVQDLKESLNYRY